MYVIQHNMVDYTTLCYVRLGSRDRRWDALYAGPQVARCRAYTRVYVYVRPVHLLRVFLLRVLESNFPGDPLSNSTDMIISTL